jgi:hypothetical protein
MLDGSNLSDAKRALLDKYMRGAAPRSTAASGAGRRGARALVPGEDAGVVAIQAGGSKRPFFFLHGQWKREIGSLCFPIAHNLGPDQPFYMLEPNTFDDPFNLPTLETIAAKHIKSMRAVQPEGPYLLGGFCNGGLVAYEMARQLYADGQRVDLLALLDPLLLVHPPRIRLAYRFIKRIGGVMRLKLDKQIRWFLLLRNAYSYQQDVAAYLREKFRRLRRFIRPQNAGQSDLDSGGDNSGVTFPKLASILPTSGALREDYPGVFTWVVMRYMPRSLYPGKVTLFWPSISTSRNGWRLVEEARDVEIHMIPGVSMGLLTDNRHLVAEHLRACLSEVQGKSAVHSR